MNRHERRRYKKIHGIEINNDEANKEFAAMQEMVNRDHEQLLEYNKKHQALIGDMEPNWALFNYVLSLVSFESCKTKTDALHILWRHVWPHFHRVCLENDILKAHIKGESVSKDILKEMLERENPEQMATKVLQIVSDLAKKRAKLKSYQVALQKDKSVATLDSN